jgi:hypothetical protein
MKHLQLFYSLVLIAFFSSCKNDQKSLVIAENTSAKTETSLTLKENKEPSQAFKDYWYQGNAEITSYTLEQARYGEIRNGNAVLIFVTEDFLPDIQVKADRQNATNIPVLKLNATKKFNTGIYPYSIMQSTFYPVSNAQHALKISSSMQEWCGHVYSQLNNRKQFEVLSHSYFEGEADQDLKLDKAILENELWTQLRIDPKSLPVGSIEVIPSLEFIRLKHVPLKAYSASAELSKNTYTLDYPELNRNLTIRFNEAFPHEIIGWEESFKSGFGSNGKTLTTKATKLETLKTAYWGQNRNADESLRTQLKLK